MDPFYGLTGVVGLLGVITFLKFYYKVEKEKETCLAEKAELAAEIKKIKEDAKDTLNRVQEYYDRRVEGDKRILENSEAMHKGFREMAIFLADEIERIDPGWFERRKKKD